MKKIGTYKILADKKLIIEYHAGKINIDEFIESRNIIISDVGYNPDFDIVFDFRDATMDVSREDITKFVEFFKNRKTIHGSRKSAYLTKKPNEVAITTLFSMRVRDLPIQTKTFSTIDALLVWLNNKSLDENTLADLITDLRKAPNRFYL